MAPPVRPLVDGLKLKQKASKAALANSGRLVLSSGRFPLHSHAPQSSRPARGTAAAQVRGDNSAGTARLMGYAKAVRFEILNESANSQTVGVKTFSHTPLGTPGQASAMLVRIKEHGVLVLCEKGADGEYLEEGITLEAA